MKMPNGQLITIPCHKELTTALLDPHGRFDRRTVLDLNRNEEVMQYTVVMHGAEEGEYWVDVPSLPRLFSQGKTIDETMNNVRQPSSFTFKD